ncbi:uncharacterized protein LOC128229851 isoform X5 [Mya arenaria]|uniref:uncharacterized protein LOC128229851 isoform X5 n=1 Tax=Mya arenaria TaxID=6604 RepID=UPI0022E44261|nr:uncharacterized protein LOC128229851 isoform X5 [Mya arenaria]
MYPITKSATQFGFSAITGVADTADNMEEYVYADDPKDGNDSSAEDTRDNSLPGPPPSQRLTKSAGPAVSYMRTQARRLHREKQGLDPNACDENEEDCFTIPWRLIPEDIVEDLEFYKNADNVLRDQIQRTTQLVFVEKEGKGMVPKLKDPINLFPKELGPQQAARWPADIQVIEKKIKHIPYVPQEPEPFYKLTGTEKTPMVRGEDRGGRLVYMYEPRSTFFVRSRVGGIKAGPEQCAISIDRSQDDTTLIFESRFESGNLARAVQVSEFEYELQLRYDLYTSKHTQWFYFSVSNTRPNKQYRFTIINFMKPDSLYNYGMKPVQYSEKDALKKIGWRRHGVGIKYYKNNTKYETSKGDKSFYSLTWTTEFNHSNDTVYLAHCFPYTYTDLQDYLLDLQNDPIKSKICKQRVLCRTLAGNLVYLLTITSPSANPEDMKHKKAVVLTARVHPGESNSSWMMKGFLDYLTGNSADSKLLRDTFIFKIVPMLNPDGVIVGNYRCSLAGRDLNRNYKTVLKDAYPTVWHTKQMIRRLLQEREIVAYCDLHGHSRRQNVFIYGCENRHNAEKRLRERIFPCMLDKNSPDKFTFDACKFKVQKSKEGTGRIVMWNMGILNSYTMEATFCGSTLGKKKGLHFTTRDFEEMGYDFCDTLLDYCDPDNTKSANVLYDLEENLKQEIRKKLELRGVHVENVDLNDDLSSYELESSDGGSDSSISDGPPVHLQFQSTREDKGTSMDGCLVPKKKKKLKTRKERDKVKESGKDVGKKGDKEKQVLEDSSGQRKPLSGHQTAHAKQEKTTIQNDLLQLLEKGPERLCHSMSKNAQVRYMQGSPKRPKSQDERAQVEAREGRGSAQGPRDNPDLEHQQKRPRKLLETAKCDAEDTQALAVSLNSSSNSELQPQMSTLSTTARNDYLEQLTSEYIRKGIMQKQHETMARRLHGKAPAHLRYSGTAPGRTPQGSGFSMEGLCPHHEQAFAAQLMAQQLQNMTGVVGNSFVRVWKDYLRKHKAPPKLQHLQLEDLVRGQAGIGGGGGVSPTPGSAAQTERRHSRHLIEVSEDRKRQEMLQQQRRPEKSASKTHSDEKLGGLSSRLKAQIPSATFVNYDTFKISQMNIDSAERQEEFTRSEELNGKDIVDEAGKREGQNKGHRHSGRKSRMGMHDSEEEEELETREGPDYVQDPHLHRPPRVKSARTGGEDMNSAIQSIKDLRQSLATSAASNTNLSPTAGNYIKKLLKQELRQTDEDIGEITARLQRNIDKKQEQYDEMLHHQQQQQQPQGSAVNTSQGQANPRPVPDQNPKPPDPRVRADKKETIKKDVPKSERREPTVLKGATKSMTNLNGNAVNEGAMLNSKLVDTYHIPDSNHSQGHKQDGFRGGKLETDYGQPKQVKNGISYSSATDLAQPQFYQNEPVTRMIRQGVNGVPRSASSSSSREESEPRSVSTTLDKNDRDRNENVQRVKSAKNSSRQVVETIPTKISLMITHDHDDRSFAGNQFLPLTRTLRGPFNKSANLPSKRK